jgi:uncharacterized protein (DUF1697 family)
MSRCVALLRGINVGGNARVEMPRLKAVFEELGTNDVSTYINSGNVIFSDTRSRKQLESLIEAAIAKEFGLNVRVVIRDSANIDNLCKEVPADWTNNAEQKTDVIFLWEEADKPDVLEEIKVNPDVDNLIYIPGAVIWNFDRVNYRRSKMHSFIGTRVYKLMTARNINTVRKLNELLKTSPTRHGIR